MLRDAVGAAVATAAAAAAAAANHRNLYGFYRKTTIVTFA